MPSLESFILKVPNLKLCYDYDKCINVFKSRDGMTHEEAVDFFHYNVSDAYVGEYTPAFLVKDDEND